MFNFTDPIEERHLRMAHIAANLCRDEHYDPTNALDKVASENALNVAEVEDVCGKLNHILFQEKFASDKLAVFNAARYENASATSSDPTTKTASVSHDNGDRVREELEKRATEIAEMPMEDPDNQDPIMDGAENKLRSHEFNRFMEQAATNASEISAHHMAIDNIVDEMKQRILALFREGIPLEEIYNTILMAVGDSQAPAVQQYFMQVIEELKTEGRIPPEQKVYIGDPEKVAADFSIEARLTDIAKDLVENTNLAIIKEAAHEVALDIITKMGRMDIAEIIDKPVEGERMIREFEKTSSMMVQNGKAAIDSLKDIISKNPGALIGSVALAGTVAALNVAAFGAAEGYRELKRKKVKKMLPNIYPELKQMDEREYSDYYDTITNLDPGLVKAPYAIAQMIKRFGEYGTIDTGNILQLQGAHKPNTAITDFAIKPMSDVLGSVGQSYLKKPKKQ